LQRLRTGEIDGRAAANEIATVSAIYKGIEIADLQARLERIETTLEKGSTSTGEFQ